MDREHLEINLNTQAQLIPYLYLKYVSQLNAIGICALLQCPCEAASSLLNCLILATQP